MNSEQSRQSRVNREQNDINANNCHTVNSFQFTHNSSLSTVHSLAFTLAETLIVMGIIGIVAALTIPNVNKNTGEAEKVAKFKKLYAELSEAHDRATAVYGPVEKWFVNDADIMAKSKRYIYRLSDFLKVQKSCRLTADITDCKGITYSDRYANFLSGGTDAYSSTLPFGYPSLLLNSGASVYYIADYTCQSYCGKLLFDIDGPKKGKNTFGIDVFLLGVTKNGIVPIYHFSDKYVENEMPGLCLQGGSYCGKWIMDFGNMDYLNANHTSPYTCKNNPSKELGWGPDKAHSCK